MYIKKYKKAKATVCVKNTCATVYGDAAKVITALTVVATAALAINAIAKAFK